MLWDKYEESRDNGLRLFYQDTRRSMNKGSIKQPVVVAITHYNGFPEAFR
jgi:hypothetical protein